MIVLINYQHLSNEYMDLYLNYRLINFQHILNPIMIYNN
jgi:hypothetical protein